MAASDEEMSAAFRAFNRTEDKSGDLSLDDIYAANAALFTALLRFNKPSPEDLRQCFLNADGQGRGFLNGDEFRPFVKLCSLKAGSGGSGGNFRAPPPGYQEAISSEQPLLQAQMAVAVPVNQFGSAANAAQVAPMPQSFAGLNGHHYQGQIIYQWIRMFDAAFAIADMQTSFVQFQKVLIDLERAEGGSLGMFGVLASPDLEHNGHWTVVFKTLEQDVCFIEFLIQTMKKYDPSMNTWPPAVAPDSPLEARDRFGYTPMVRSAEKARDKIVRILIEAGVDKRACVTGTTNNAATCASAKGHSKIVKLLNTHGVQDPNAGCCVIA
jgi:hypothetical protein